MTDPLPPVPSGEFLLYTTEEGHAKLDVRLTGETVWLNQKQMAELFQKDVRTVSEHIRNIFQEGELEENSVIRNFRTTAADGKTYNVVHFNLDVIISVGYRVKSHRGTQFRIWATQRLREYLIKGFAMDDFLRFSDRDQLEGAGQVSHEAALAKAQAEFDKFRKTLVESKSPVEEHFEDAWKRAKRLGREGPPGET
jgi:hypothetical protein